MFLRPIFLATVAALFIPACHATPPEPVTSHVFKNVSVDTVWHMPGLRARVEIGRDIYGIPHFYASNVYDLLYVQGYQIAQDRFWQMDMFRRVSRGDLSTMLGVAPILMDVDEMMRAINLTDDGRMVYDVIVEEMTSEERAFLQAFCDGVNLWLEHAATGVNGAQLPPEYNELLLGMIQQPAAMDIPRWKPADSLAMGRLQQWLLSGSDAGREVLLGRLHEATVNQGALRNTLLRFAPAEHAAVLDDWEGIQPPAAPTTSAPYAPLSIDGASTLEKLGAIQDAFPFSNHGDWGSNNWVLGPSRTESGHVLLANDPHLALFNPALFYQAHFNTTVLGNDKGEAWNAYGVVFPGIPVLMIGHNERIAWGVTVLGYDVYDVYREEVVLDGTAVRRGAETIPIEYSPQEYCHGYSGECLTRPLAYVPGHGPKLPGDAEFLTFRYTGRESTHDFRAFRDLMTATDLNTAFLAIRQFKVGAQNFVVGDIYGNFGYLGQANIPIRDPACKQPPWMPLDGASGNCEWLGYLDESQIPFSINPPSGYLATANNDTVGTTFDNDPGNDAQYYLYNRDVGFRAARIRKLLDAQEKFTPADLERIQADTFVREGERLAPYIVTAGLERPELVTAPMQVALGYLAAWAYGTPTGLTDPFTGVEPTDQEIVDSVAASVYITFLRLLQDNLVTDEHEMLGLLDKAPGIALVGALDVHGILGAYRVALYALENTTAAANIWDDVRTMNVVETKEEILLKTLGEAVEWLTQRFETTDQSTWRWGKLHYARFYDPYGYLGADVRSLGPYPNDGAATTVDAAHFGFMGGDHPQLSGPVMRMVTELNPERIRSWNSLPGGQVHDRWSPFYENLVEYWMTNTSYEVPFYQEDVKAQLHSLTVVLPAGE
jgi:penicillin G amidase